MKITALIPARSGSKGIPEKNTKPMDGIPLIYYSIEQAKKSKYINDIVVSTDSEKTKKIVESYDVPVNYLRPEEISGDLSTDYEFIKYHVEWCKENSVEIPDFIVQLRPTYPLRKVSILDDCIEKITQNEYDSLRTVVPNDKTPYKMYVIECNILLPLFNEVNGVSEPYNQPRQILPQTYIHNGYVDIINVKSFLENDSITGTYIYPYILPKSETHDIDTMDHWKKVENIIKKENGKNPQRRKLKFRRTTTTRTKRKMDFIHTNKQQAHKYDVNNQSIQINHTTKSNQVNQNTTTTQENNSSHHNKNRKQKKIIRPMKIAGKPARLA